MWLEAHSPAQYRLEPSADTEEGEEEEEEERGEEAQAQSRLQPVHVEQQQPEEESLPFGISESVYAALAGVYESSRSS